MTPVILVCGTRKIDPKKAYFLVRDALDKIIIERGWITESDEYGNFLPEVKIIAGAAKGIDTAAVNYAVVNWQVFEEFPADWDKYGKSAGRIRNQQMLDEGKPDLVVAFPGPESIGTWDMIRRAKKAGVEVIIIEAK